MPKLNFSYKEHCDILKAYKFKDGGFNKSSHHFFIGRINGKDCIVQVIFNHKERKRQSDKTMKLSVKNSGISKKRYEEWKNDKTVHGDIIN